MSLDLLAERAAILALAKTMFNGRVYESVPDDAVLERYTVEGQNLVKPYCIIVYGAMIGTGTDRTVGNGEADQPQSQPVTFQCWAATDSIALDSSSAVRVKFLGFVPNDPNTTEMIGGGGTSFASRDANGRPSRFLSTCNFTFDLNMSRP